MRQPIKREQKFFVLQVLKKNWNEIETCYYKHDMKKLL